jgi:hypothetical protein
MSLSSSYIIISTLVSFYCFLTSEPDEYKLLLRDSFCFAWYDAIHFGTESNFYYDCLLALIESSRESSFVHNCRKLHN